MHPINIYKCAKLFIEEIESPGTNDHFLVKYLQKHLPIALNKWQIALWVTQDQWLNQKNLHNAFSWGW